MLGDDLGNFNPNKIVTRAEMATMICRMMGSKSGGPIKATFADVPTSHWANSFINEAVNLGIVNGYGNGKFGPSDTVTYIQAVAMVLRAAGMDGLAERWGGYPDGYIEVATEYGYSGELNIGWNTPLERWQVAMILYPMYQKAATVTIPVTLYQDNWESEIGGREEFCPKITFYPDMHYEFYTNWASHMETYSGIYKISPKDNPNEYFINCSIDSRNICEFDYNSSKNTWTIGMTIDYQEKGIGLTDFGTVFKPRDNKTLTISTGDSFFD